MISIALALAIQSQGALVLGGEMSCARWQSSSAYVQAGRFWILGYWSGKNMQAALANDTAGGVGRTTDADGVVAEVKLACEASPSKSLVMATTETYERFRRAGR
jgi:hypothetical protein